MELLVALLLGLSFGSFATHVLFTEQLSFTARSSCVFCKKKLPIYTVIPAISFLLLRGKTQCCGKKIPISYLIWEVATAIGFMCLVYFLGLKLGLFYALLLFFLAVQTMSDLFTKHVLNDFSYFFIILFTVVHSLFGFNAIGIVAGFLIPFILLGTQYYFSNGRWIGKGDVLISIGIGSALYHHIGYVLLFAYCIGAIYAIFVYLHKKDTNVVPFVPFLLLGTILTLAVGHSIDRYIIAI